ncbi:hypothetical protein CBM2634_U180007 [Cupriavidus taiwanensis]|uniref:Uncharacterized protein n=1 Tax=Cupriavidus taiwanensis TaxID=164546 RepID=A0A375JDD9_9BURK|nr:hypothetical protein CBM2634_U180007 [Cupriavidus taiwanensis]
MFLQREPHKQECQGNGCGDRSAIRSGLCSRRPDRNMSVSLRQSPPYLDALVVSWRSSTGVSIFVKQGTAIKATIGPRTTALYRIEGETLQPTIRKTLKRFAPLSNRCKQGKSTRSCNAVR